MRFYTNSTERLRISDTGRFGVGTTAIDAGYRMTVSGLSNGILSSVAGNNVASLTSINTDGSDSWLRIVPKLGAGGYNGLATESDVGLIFSCDSDNTTSASNGLLIAAHSQVSGGIYIQENGLVGVGTSTPSEKLHVQGGSILVTPVLYASNQNQYMLKAGASNNSGWDGMGLKIKSDASGVPYISICAVSGVSVLNVKGGNVGIGTESPMYKLQVSGTTYITNGFGDPSAAAGYRLKFYDNGGTYNDAGIGLDGSGGGSENMWFNALNGFYWNFGTNGKKMVLLTNGNLGIGVTVPKAKLQVEDYGIDTTATASAATTQIAIHTFPIADFRSARFTIQITNTTDTSYHSTEILAIHDGTTANITEFGEVHTGTSVEATFDADVNSSNFRLLATPASADNMVFKVVCHSLTV